jgi:activator of HSP90 ATPase
MARIHADKNMILNIFCASGGIRVRSSSEILSREGTMTDHKTREAVSEMMTRRGVIMGMAALAAGLDVRMVVAQEMKKVPAKSANAKRTSLHQEVDFPVGPERIYRLLLDSKEFTDLSGMSAEIEAVPGGAFSMFGNIIYGRNIELIANERVIQAWGDKGWGSGVYSIARFDLNKQRSGTRVVLDHTGFPEGSYDHLYEGWKGHYWDPMRKYFA